MLRRSMPGAKGCMRLRKSPQSVAAQAAMLYTDPTGNPMQTIISF